MVGPLNKTPHPIANKTPSIPQALPLEKQLNDQIKKVIQLAYSYKDKGSSVLHENLTGKWAFQRFWGDDNRTLKKIQKQGNLDPKTAKESALKVAAIIRKGFGDRIHTAPLKDVANSIAELESLASKVDTPIQANEKPIPLSQRKVTRLTNSPPKRGMRLSGLQKTSLAMAGILFLGGIKAALAAKVQDAQSLDVAVNGGGDILGRHATQGNNRSMGQPCSYDH